MPLSQKVICNNDRLHKCSHHLSSGLEFLILHRVVKMAHMGTISRIYTQCTYHVVIVKDSNGGYISIPVHTLLRGGLCIIRGFLVTLATHSQAKVSFTSLASISIHHLLKREPFNSIKLMNVKTPLLECGGDGKAHLWHRCHGTLIK